MYSVRTGNVAQRVVGAGAREAGTEAIQNPLQYAAETAGTEKGFDFLEAADQAAAGAVGGFGAGTGLRTTTEACYSWRSYSSRRCMKQLVILPDAWTLQPKTMKPNTEMCLNQWTQKAHVRLLDDAHVEHFNEEICPRKSYWQKFEDRPKNRYRRNISD